LLASAEEYKTLAEAVADCTLVVGHDRGGSSGIATSVA